MELILAHIAQRSRSDLLDRAERFYQSRLKAFATVQSLQFRAEEALFEFIRRHRARTPLHAVLLDAAGKQFSSVQFAHWLGELRDAGQQTVLFAVGPASGWSQMARSEVQMLLSLGSLTFPHELARVILAEQVYRAFTILAGHPYHTGH